jgi:RNA polymerase sigma-70 factor (ECF subfamily)
LVSLYGPLIYSWCRRAGVQPADAADLGQEVFRAVARKVGDFRHAGPGGSFRGWLRTITTNKLRDHARRVANGPAGEGGSDAQHRLLQIPSSQPEEDECLAAYDDRLVCRRAVELIRAEFEDTTFQAFWRVVVEDERPADVAAALGLSVNAVYLAKSRVLRRTREEFEGLLEG